MDYRLIEKGKLRYIECIPDGQPLASEADVLDLLTACGEEDTNLLLIQGEALPDEFFDLKTRFAGMVLQKLINYYVRMAVVVSDGRASRGRFRELVVESNRGKDFGVFETTDAAEEWLSR